LGIPEGRQPPQRYPAKTNFQTIIKLSTETQAKPLWYAVLQAGLTRLDDLCKYSGCLYLSKFCNFNNS